MLTIIYLYNVMFHMCINNPKQMLLSDKYTLYLVYYNVLVN